MATFELEWEYPLRLVVALILTGSIGLERERGSAGLGRYTLAATTVLLALVVLRGLSVVERRWLHGSPNENSAQMEGEGEAQGPPEP